MIIYSYNDYKYTTDDLILDKPRIQNHYYSIKRS
nr:MAG TPA: hypothetical protein [Caudoviricetes sp.]